MKTYTELRYNEEQQFLRNIHVPNRRKIYRQKDSSLRELKQLYNNPTNAEHYQNYQWYLQEVAWHMGFGKI